MSIRTINGISGGSSTNVYVNNMFADGEAIEVVQTSNTTQAKVNVAFKSNTDATTTLNDDDWMLIADNATGKIVKRITVSNVKNEATHWTLNSTKLYPDATTYNVLLGTTSNTNSRKLMVDGTAEVTGVLILGNKINDLTLPTGTKTLATLTGTETLSSKTLTTPIIADLNKTADGFTMNVPTPSEAGETLILTVKTQILTNKTLSTNSNWNGNVIAYNYGGTAQSSWTKGDILYADNNNSLAKLSIGSTGQVLKVASGLPSWGTDNDTNYFSKVSSNIYPINTTDNFLVGTSSNGVSAKLYVDGDAYLVGDEIVITGEKNSTGSTSTAFTLNGKSYDATSGNMTAYTEMIKLVNPQKSGASDKDPTLQVKAGHLELRGTETEGSTRIDCFSINALQWGGSSFSDYDDIINILNPAGSGSASFPKLQFKLEGQNGANQVLSCNASGHCFWGAPVVSLWSAFSSEIYPLTTSTNVLIGTTSNSTSAKLHVEGNTQLNGTLKNSFTGLFSFSFINNNFYNDANRTIHLEQDSGTYGYQHTAFDATPAVYSNLATYCSSSGTAISAIGSENNNRFGLYANDDWFMVASPANRNYIVMGQGVRFNSALVPVSALHIENSVSDLSAQDTTILIKSNSSTYDSRLTLSVNSATDGTGSAQEIYIEGNSGKNLKLTATDVRMYLSSGSERFRFTGGSLQAIGTNLITTRTPPTSAGNTVETNLRISGGNGTSTATGWGSAGGTRYYVESFIPPTHIGGPFHTWLEDTATANFGWSYGSTFLIAMDSSSNLVGASTWTTSDERIKEDIVNADPNECINIIKRLPLKKYKYKKILRENCIGFNDKPVYGWIAQQFKEDPDMSYAWRTYDKMKYYDKETNSEEIYEVDNIEIINKSSINAVSWGAITGLINIIEQQQQQINQQQAIIDKLINATSFKSFRESL